MKSPKVASETSSTQAAADILEVLLFEGTGGMVTPLFFRCKSELDCERWIEALHPASIAADEHPEWDCPQARVVKSYDACHADELTLRVGDLLKVLKKEGGEAGAGWAKGRIELSARVDHHPSLIISDRRDPRPRSHAPACIWVVPPRVCPLHPQRAR